jgi:hypothetical protein
MSVRLGYGTEKGEGKSKAVKGKGQNEEIISFSVSYRVVPFLFHGLLANPTFVF